MHVTAGLYSPVPGIKFRSLLRGPFIVSELVKVFFRFCHLVPSTTPGTPPSRTYKYRSTLTVSPNPSPTALLITGSGTPVSISQTYQLNELGGPLLFLFLVSQFSSPFFSSDFLHLATQAHAISLSPIIHQSEHFRSVRT